MGDHGFSWVRSRELMRRALGEGIRRWPGDCANLAQVVVFASEAVAHADDRAHARDVACHAGMLAGVATTRG